jgi:hypothetical protein
MSTDEGGFSLELTDVKSDDPVKVDGSPVKGSTERQYLETWRSEVDAYHQRMVGFSEVEPDDIFMDLAGISARMSEIRKDAVRSGRRDMNAFRTQEIDPLISECDRQFKYWSRVVTVRGIDAQLAGGT